MSNVKKLLMSGAAGGAGLDIEEVFATTLYTGAGSSGITVTTGLDVSTEGGIAWIKCRDQGNDHIIIDPQKYPNGNYWIYVSETYAPQNIGENVFSFSSTGWTVAGSLTNSDNPRYNGSSKEYVSWNFRQAPSFFDVVTYTGTQVSGRTISHNLGSTPGVIFIKKLDSNEDWTVFHRDLNTNSGGNYTQFVKLNDIASAFGGTGSSASTCEDVQNVSSTTFTIGNDNRVNTSNAEYVAYLFAHHNDDGGFGPNSDQDIIKCGSYTGNGSSDGPTVNLGFEPQWLLTKRTDSSGSWQLHDSMRGVHFEDNDNGLRPDASNTESSANYFRFTPTGFKLEGSSSTVNSNNGNYIYMAIRRGSLLEPTSSTDIFDMETWTGNNAGSRVIDTDITHDTALLVDRGTGNYFTKAMYNRLTGDEVQVTSSNQPDSYWTGTATRLFHDVQEGIQLPTSPAQWNSSSDNFIGYFWKRAPSFFDVVTYTGLSANTAVTHNLGIVPEMIWTRSTSNAQDWYVYHKDLGSSAYMKINSSNAATTSSNDVWQGVDPTATTFTIGGYLTSFSYVAWLFGSVNGVSKVGSYTGDGTTNGSKVIDCGFSNGAKFVLVKSSSHSGDWAFFDTDRGIVSGNDSGLFLNNNSTENNGFDVIDPHSSGFAVNDNGGTYINENGRTYIFYAVAT
tara:strand:+ start:306 stop:2324 length:2019 start_codon:yes stop_codon:yes gene_type:complete